MNMLSTSLSPSADYVSEDEEVPESRGGTPREKRKRSSRACDQCRKTKSKCERPPGSIACRNCQVMKQECTFLGPSRKRGPPKGYITALEARVHRLEALWGVLLSSSDSRAQTLVADVAEDGLARDILGEVERGAFGPIGRTRILQSQSEIPEPGPSAGRDFVPSRTRREQYILGNEADPSLPSYQWQDRLANHLRTRGLARRQGQSAPGDKISAPYAFSVEDIEQTEPEYGLALPTVRKVSPPLGSFSLATRRPQDAETIWHALYDPDMPNSEEESEYASDDPADAVGQLSLNEKQQVGFHGKTSGMHILAKPERSDSLNAGGIWHLPQTRFWPKAQRSRPMIEEDLHLDDTRFPSLEEQHRLLELYWTYVQPVMPVLDKAKFLAEYAAERGRLDTHSNAHEQSKPPRKVPRLLLLAMFTIAARYSDVPPQPPEGNMWEAGCDYLDDAKLILNWTYDSPRPSTCQALVLLAYREFGIGAISQAWIYMGMAFRMATDLGMHRAADRWQRSGRVLFTGAEMSSRKRLWHCCVILDRIMAFAMGRPMSIRERDYDTAYPSTEENEEFESWTPRPADGHVPTPVRTLSTLNATAGLSSILALIMDTTYACRSGVSFIVRHAESFRTAKLLDEWYNGIPEHLRYDPNVDRVAPLPHVLTLHMMYWCVVLLVHRPFIRHHKHTLDHRSMSENEISAMSAESFSCSASAACRVAALVDVYCKNWDISRANAFISWYVLSAGVMHVASLTMRMGSQVQARLGLRQCLDAFDKMKVVWPSSARAWQILRGAELDLSTTPSTEDIPQTTQQPDKYPTSFGDLSKTGTSANTQLTVGTGTYPSLTSTLGAHVNGPAPNMSYFPGYDHWPPESLVFDPPFTFDHGQGPETFDETKVSANLYDLTASMDASGLTMPLDWPGMHLGRGDVAGGGPIDPRPSWEWSNGRRG